MTNQVGEFIAKVIKTLKKNGYPDKQVSLPLDRMYELAAKQGCSFNKVLDFLKEKEQIDHKKTNEKIIFFPLNPQSTEVSDGPAAAQMGTGPGGFDPSRIAQMMGGLNADSIDGDAMGGMMRQAAEMLKHMSPEQIQQIQSMVENLSEEERDDLMRKARDFGFPS